MWSFFGFLNLNLKLKWNVSFRRFDYFFLSVNKNSLDSWCTSNTDYRLKILWEFWTLLIDWWIDQSKAMYRNRGPGYNTLLLWLIPWDFYSLCPHRQFHMLPGLLHSWAALLTPSRELHAKQGGSLYNFYDGLWYDLAGYWTHDLPHQRERHAKHWSNPMGFQLKLNCLSENNSNPTPPHPNHR